MATPQFVHLRIHSEYSIVDSLVRINDIIAAATNDGQAALAITDLSNLFGVIKFYQAAWRNGIKPIIGCDVWITNQDNRNKPFRLLLLVKNHHGYLQLCNLLTRAWLTNLYRGRAEIDIKWLAQLLYETGGNDLIALSGAHFGNIGIAIDNVNLVEAERCARRWGEIFPNAFYIEIQRTGQANMEMQVRQSLILAEKLKLPVVATHPVQFLSSDEFIAHEVRTCIAQGEILANSRRIKCFKKEQNFKTHMEMISLFADLPGAIRNTVEIAKRCNLVLQLGKPQLPNFSPPNNISIDDFLVMQAKAGLEKRLHHLFCNKNERENMRWRYEARVKFETDTIIKMGFSSYFLIVADFIQWAKNHAIPVGPGRGSGASSLVAYSLLITDLDPLAYNLLFERFLNPERVSMPDFDIDFCQEGRDQVIQYVKERYGKEAVSQIATFGTMAAKGAVRDVGRVLDLSYSFCNSISKLIPFKPGKLVTIIDAIEEEPLLKERLNNEEEVKQLLNLAQQVEGIVRNIGMHAGGVLIAPSKLTNFCPLYTQAGAAGVVSQYDKDDVEAIGLVKFDFLGLTTLTILDRAVRYIHQLDPMMKNFSLASVPMNDCISYHLLSQAKTVAVFQLESRGMQNMLKEARPDRFEDIIALVALYRPGPMDLISDFCKRKHGEKFAYLDPRMEDILSETYGIMVYQEQVMQMAQVVGGYSLGSADLLRRAMGKKKPEEMAQHRLIFSEGAAKDGLTKDKADEIFDLMEKFAGYGFNKSHAAAYALLSYYTAYLKAHHPAAFMAANLSLAMDDTDKIKILIEDAINICGLNILPPDINQSDYYFVPVNLLGQQAVQIRYGLGAIKGSGQNAVAAIVAARQNTPFDNLFDFAKRVDKRHINRRTVDALIRAGAFDCFQQDRAVLQASINLALENAEQIATFANQVSLFDNYGSDFEMSLEYIQVCSWTNKQRLTKEKSVLGFYLSGHLFDAYKKEVRQFVHIKISTLEPLRELCLIAGIIVAIRTQLTQRGGKLLIVTLDDGSGVIDVIIYNELLELHKSCFKEDELLVVQGKVSEDRFSGRLRVIAEKVMDIIAARIKYGQRVLVSLNKKINPAHLRSALLSYRQAHGLLFVVKYIQFGIVCEIAFGDTWRVLPSDDLQVLLKECCDQATCIIEY